MTSPASMRVKLIRSRFLFLREVRNALSRRGYLEVDTAHLLPEINTDPFISPVSVEVEAGGSQHTLYLHTSPEFELKRLVTLGFDAVCEITHVFRAGDYSRVHNPEFCMAEWYRLGWTYKELMDELEDILLDVFKPGPHRLSNFEWPSSVSSMSIDDVCSTAVGFSVSDLQDEGMLYEAACKRALVGNRFPRDFSQVFSWLWVGHVNPYLETKGAVFLVGWPVSLGELARTDPENPLLAERFELVYRGIELANGYQELTDPVECLARSKRNLELRARESLHALPLPTSFVSEVCSALPMSAGLSLGVDRLAMLAAGVDSVHDLLSWSFDRVDGMSR